MVTEGRDPELSSFRQRMLTEVVNLWGALILAVLLLGVWCSWLTIEVSTLRTAQPAAVQTQEK